MEIEELKKIWEEENNILANKVRLNQEAIKKMNLQSALSTFNVFLKISIVGRNLALVYFMISMVVGFMVLEQYHYSIPVFIGGLLMLWSFFHHLALEKYKKAYNSSVVELQKSIENFRIHSVKSGPYDLFVVMAWALSLAPVHLAYINKINIYTEMENLLRPALFIGGFLLFLFLFSAWVYKFYDKKLRSSENRLEEIIAFEKE